MFGRSVFRLKPTAGNNWNSGCNGPYQAPGTSSREGTNHPHSPAAATARLVPPTRAPPGALPLFAGKGFDARNRLPNRIRIKRRMRLSKRYCIYGKNIISDQSGSCGTWRATIRCAFPMPPFTESSNGTVSVDYPARWVVERCIRNATTSGCQATTSKWMLSF